VPITVNPRTRESRLFGSIFSYTGPAAFLGDRMKRSVELYVEEANKKGGIQGHPIELFMYDAGSESSKAVLAAKRLHRRSPKGHRRSLREIAKELAALGHTNKSGASYSASCVKSMVEGH